MRIVKAIRTSTACPSQWDAWDEDGNYVYLRYRHGHGTATIYRSGPTWPETNEKGEPVADFDHGGPYDGHLELESFCQIAGIELALENPEGWRL